MNQRRGVLIFVAGLSLVLGALVPVLNAQSDRGTITGTVTDQTGAAIVGVSRDGYEHRDRRHFQDDHRGKRKLHDCTPAGRNLPGER